MLFVLSWRGASGAGELGVVRGPVDAGDLAEQRGGDQHAAAGLGQQLWRELRDESCELVLDPVDGAGEVADATQLVAGDP